MQDRCGGSVVGARWTFRDERASPSGSRTVGQRTTSVMPRSRAIRSITRSCWPSFSPK